MYTDPIGLGDVPVRSSILSKETCRLDAHAKFYQNVHDLLKPQGNLKKPIFSTEIV